MRVLIIVAVVTLTAAAPQFSKKTREYAAEATSGVISEDGKVMETNKALRAQRFLRSTDDSESTTDNINEGVSVANDLSKEIAEEMRWAAEEKKWQEQAKAETELAKLDGEAANNMEPQDSDEELAEESLWLADEKKWDEQEDQGTEATELEGEVNNEQEDFSSDAEESSESLTPAVLVVGVDSTISKDVETFIPQLSLIPNNVLPWLYSNAYATTWIYQFPQYYQVPDISTY